ncbi:MAG: TRAP transporter small permease subunit [Alphaproteobacteria bacterium]|nr:TRAP transporter small permease subunit [Alphaproteobacteria bacterium]
MNLIDRLNRFLGEAVSYLYLVAVAVTGYEVVMRYLFNAPTSWAFELTILLCAIAYLLSGGYVTQANAHIRITSISDRLPKSFAWGLELFGMIVGVFALGVLAWAGFKPALFAIEIVERTGSAWNSPMPAILKPLIVVGSALIVAQLLVQIVRHLRSR